MSTRLPIVDSGILKTMRAVEIEIKVLKKEKSAEKTLTRVVQNEFTYWLCSE